MADANSKQAYKRQGAIVLRYPGTTAAIGASLNPPKASGRLLMRPPALSEANNRLAR